MSPLHYPYKNCQCQTTTESSHLTHNRKPYFINNNGQMFPFIAHQRNDTLRNAQSNDQLHTTIHPLSQHKSIIQSRTISRIKWKNIVQTMLLIAQKLKNWKWLRRHKPSCTYKQNYMVYSDKTIEIKFNNFLHYSSTVATPARVTKNKRSSLCGKFLQTIDALFLLKTIWPKINYSGFKIFIRCSKYTKTFH